VKGEEDKEEKSKKKGTMENQVEGFTDRIDAIRGRRVRLDINARAV